MITREDILERRDELLARRAELMDRADRIREEFMDSVDSDAVTMAAGLSLVSGGLAWGITQVIRRHRSVLSLLPPIGLVALGLVVAGRGAMNRRGMLIDAAEERVRGELSSLDPLARARVLRDMAGDALPFVHHSQN